MSQAGGLNSSGGGGAGITTIIGNTGSATGATITLQTIQTGHPAAGPTTSFAASGSAIKLSFTDANSNTILGSSGNSSITGANNTAIGRGIFTVLADGYRNTAIGSSSQNAMTNGFSNTSIGMSSLGANNGNFNIAVGYSAGSSLNGAESNNIFIGNLGGSGLNNQIRIGIQGSGDQQQNQCYIAGIKGATYEVMSPKPSITYCETLAGQLVANLAINSSIVTTNFGSLTGGAASQNTSPYAILLNISVVVSSATNATIVLGIGSTNTPTTNVVVTTFSTASSLTFSFCAFVPSNYYILVDTTGTIAVTSITTQASAIA